MATDYGRLKTPDLHALYKESCAKFKALSEEITAMRVVLQGRQEIAEATAVVTAAQARIAAAQKREA